MHHACLRISAHLSIVINHTAYVRLNLKKPTKANSAKDAKVGLFEGFVFFVKVVT